MNRRSMSCMMAVSRCVASSLPARIMRVFRGVFVREACDAKLCKSNLKLKIIPSTVI